MDNQWPNIFRPISNPLAFEVFYLVKYYGGFIYFISHLIKNQLKNTATLMGGFQLDNFTGMLASCIQQEWYLE